MSSENKVMISLIVAMASNRVIGRNNQLPWSLPSDLKYFKSMTMGKPIVMGRKTFESIGKPLPGRTNIVVTNNRAFKAEGVSVVHSLDEAIELATEVALGDDVAELMVIGGAQLYEAILPRVERLYLTEVQAEVEGDAWFPALDFSQWNESHRDDFQAVDATLYGYSFVVYDRSV